MTPPKTDKITLSLNDAEIVFEEKGDNPEVGDVPLAVSKDSGFKFQYIAGFTDQFEVKKYTDPATQKHYTEIWLSRGLGNKTERIPLVRIIRK